MRLRGGRKSLKIDGLLGGRSFCYPQAKYEASEEIRRNLKTPFGISCDAKIAHRMKCDVKEGCNV